MSFGLWLSFSEFWNAQAYRWTIRQERYTYQIVDENAHELFAFHWDPLQDIAFPHLHLGFGMRGHQLPIDNKAHIPTGRVSVVDIISFVMLELRVKPLLDDWQTRLEVARQIFADLEG
ncbi:MAG: hypothetical protein JO340_11505 [Acidobacteriaceae bacterium]|nr:hypothetical protein [Acidobacteriaceae bacterium]